MATVVRRTFRSSPHRDAFSTWRAIVDLLSQGNASAKADLESIAGIASSIIADKACESSPIVVSCDGPQTRIYCIFDDDAIDGSDANEGVLTHNPLNGDWSISLPCQGEDLGWLQSALKAKTNRITARDLSEKRSEAPETVQQGALQINVKEFLKP